MSLSTLGIPPCHWPVRGTRARLISDHLVTPIPSTQNAALFASGVFTCLKFGSTIIFIFGGVHFFKRKTLMVGGAFFMGVLMFALGGVLAKHPPGAAGVDSAGSPAARGMMAIIYLFVVAYSLSWGPLSW